MKHKGSMAHRGDDRGMAKVHKVMSEYGMGKLHSGSKHGPVVSGRKQAVAIAMHEAGMSRRRSTGGT